MSFFFQYLILKAIFKTASRKNVRFFGIPVPVSELKLLLPKKFIKKYCVILSALDYVNYSAADDGLVSITPKGISYLLEFKSYMVKAVFNVLLAVLSAVLGFYAGILAKI